VDTCVADARELIGREITARDLLIELEKDIPFYEQSGGGVTFSGGEPLLQHAFLVEALQLCKGRGLHTAVDTTGFTTPEILRRVSTWTDLFLFDIKSLDDPVHRSFTGVSNQCILENLRLLDRWEKPVSLRVPVIPGVNDRLEHLAPVARLAAGLPCVRDMHLLPFHLTGVDKYKRIGREYTFPPVTPLSRETLEALAKTLRSIHPRIRIGG
jgi:pyruvate formate lyase activating enzyme